MISPRISSAKKKLQQQQRLERYQRRNMSAHEDSHHASGSHSSHHSSPDGEFQSPYRSPTKRDAVAVFQNLKRQSLVLEGCAQDNHSDFFYKRIEANISRLEAVILPADDQVLATQRDERLLAMYRLEAQRPMNRSHSQDSPRGHPTPPRSRHSSQRESLPSSPNLARGGLPSAASLSTFDGKASSWRSFTELFMELVGTNRRVSDLYKIDQLAKVVPQHAAFIRSFETCEDAIAALSPQYASRGAIWSDLLAEIEKVPPLTRQSSIADWRRMESILYLARRQVPMCDSVGRNQVHGLFKGKLPPHMWEQYHYSDDRSLDALGKLVSRKVVGLREAEDELVFAPRPHHQSRPTPVDSTKSNKRSSHARLETVLVTQATPSQRPSTSDVERNSHIDPCLFCKAMHLRKDCPLPRLQKQHVVIQEKRCRSCLKPRENHYCSGRGCNNCQSDWNGLVCLCRQATVTSNTSAPPPPPMPSGNRANIPAQGTGNSRWAPNAERRTQLPSSGTTNSRQSYNPQVHLIQLEDSAEDSSTEDLLSSTPTVLSIKTESTNNVFLPTLQLLASNPVSQEQRKVRVLLDEAATSSFITEHIADRLNLPKTPIPRFTVGMFAGARSVPITSETVITLRAVLPPFHEITVPLYVTSGILVNKLDAAPPHVHQEAKKLGVSLADEFGEEIDILLGQDLYTEHVLLEWQQSLKLESGLALVNTKFGWTVQGATGGRKPRGGQVHFISTGPNRDEAYLVDEVNFTEKKCVCQDLSKLMHFTEDAPDSTVEQWADEYQKQIIYNQVERRFYAALPWYNKERPATNYQVARKQCLALRTRLVRNGGFAEYDKSLLDLVTGGFAIIRPVEPEPSGYYLPHFPVYKPNSATTPMRPVFNASSTSQGEKALNHCIYKGAWIHVQLVQVLLRWRLHTKVVLADIRKAFLQIRVQPTDRKYLRFLWFCDEQVRTFEMTSVLFGAASAPYILYAVLRVLFQQFAPDLSSILDNVYMDDILLLDHSTESMQAQLLRVKSVMALGSFELHKWAATRSLAETLSVPLATTESWASCLGQKWNLENDHIGFNLPQLSGGKMTRRTLASDFAKTFDPLQLLGPYHTQVKLLFRDLIPHRQPWDQEVTPEVKAQATALLGDLRWLPKVIFPRLARISDQFELWGAGDASAVALGAVFYVHDIPSGQSQLLLSRGRLSSPKRTIPELELMAAVLLAETLPVVLQCCPKTPARVLLFTDSQVTWHRLHSDPNKHSPFVATRIRKILQASEQPQWHYLPTKANPADLVSRGRSLQLLRHCKLWSEGPPVAVVRESIDVTAQLHRSSHTWVYALQSQMVSNDVSLLSRMVEENTHIRLHLALLHLLRFMSRFIDLPGRFLARTGKSMSLEGLVDVYKWSVIQRLQLEEELVKARAHPGNAIYDKQPIFVDDCGLLRINRRLEYSEHTFEVRYPMVLKDAKATRAYIAYVHGVHANHGGAAITTYFVRQTVYLINVARITQEVVYECPTCRRYRLAKPFSVPKAPLPPFRVQKGYAFQVIGTDIAGPIKNDHGKNTKFYFLIFTCMKSRAVHLELLQSCEASAVTRAFQRFCCLYGRPSEVWSDNGLGFKKLGQVLHRLYLRYTEAITTLQNQPNFSQTRWHFNSPEAPWQGGVWESLIRSIKSAINRAHLAAATDYEQLLTVILEAQRFVNARPIWYRAGSPPLTPAHLVFGRPLDFPLPIRLPINGKTDRDLLDYALLQNDMNLLWDYWRDFYLLSLKQRYWKKNTPPRLGELVLIRSERAARHEWPLATVVELKPSPVDGHYRTAQVKTLSGQVYRRALQSLVPVERGLGGEDESLPSIDSSPHKLHTSSVDDSPLSGGAANTATVGRAQRAVPHEI